MINLFLIWIFLIQLCLYPAEYRIKRALTPSMLSMVFGNLSDQIFPNDIIVEISFNQVEGTFLYSIDNNKNQLIISLSDATEPRFDVEINKKHFGVSLPKLCSCEYCKFEKLKLRIQLRELFYIQCNDGVMQSHKYESAGEINKAYPVPKFIQNGKLQAHLWLVNTPIWEDLFPNSAQLSGCIFDVLYKMKPITMERHEVGDECKKTCNDKICNSGKCLETYDNSPICNCTSSFQNGLFCNDTLRRQNITVDQEFQFKTIKLSFTSPSVRLFRLKNTKLDLELLVKGTLLFFKMNCSKTFSIHTEATITDQYDKNEKNILILEFHDNSVNVKFKGGTKNWIDIFIPHYHDFSRDIFEHLLLESGNGTIDMVYKTDLRQPRWIDMNFIGSVIQYVPKELSSNTTTSMQSCDNVTPTKLIGLLPSKDNQEFSSCLLNGQGDVILKLTITILVLVVVSLALTIVMKARKFHRTKRMKTMYKRDIISSSYGPGTAPLNEGRSLEMQKMYY